ncbi:hypothetical protein SVAN01_09907 [Stagonosporopsis vannaccii]|nr:hypothetical protein SVAN01_09907 [Stagonosporopsis vannaccii]
MLWSTQCLLSASGSYAKIRILASSAACATRLRAELPRTSSKHNIDTAPCPDARLLFPAQMRRLSVSHLPATARARAPFTSRKTLCQCRISLTRLPSHSKLIPLRELHDARKEIYDPHIIGKCHSVTLAISFPTYTALIAECLVETMYPAGR